MLSLGIWIFRTNPHPHSTTEERGKQINCLGVVFMNLNEVLKDIEVIKTKGNTDIDIKDIASDSRTVAENSLFVCIKGYKTDGNQYVKSAVENGAVCIISEDDMDLPEDITLVIVKDSRIALSQIANNFFDYPSKRFNLIGVTGTNGKTTTTYLIKSILERVGQKVGLIGTIVNKIGEEEIPADRTTPDIIELQKLFKRMADENVDSTVMEVSSHSLELHRVDGSDFDIGVFTNLTQDHLDFHGTLENYLDAKIKLFNMAKIGIINKDDSSSLKVISSSKCEILTYGIENSVDLNAKNISNTDKGITYDLYINDNCYKVSLAIPGRFTVYNSLAAIGVCLKLGVGIEDIISGLALVKGVSGRSEVVPINKDYTIIIDYAHTPDGIENILNSVRQFAKGRVVTLFGCGGDRDKTKRPIMGEFAGKLSDFCIVTSDNPRTENPSEIIAQVEEGVKRTDCQYVVIESRYDAIEYAIKNAKKDDVIVLAGKGHEDYQILKDKTIHFDEREVIQEILEKM